MGKMFKKLAVLLEKLVQSTNCCKERVLETIAFINNVRSFMLELSDLLYMLLNQNCSLSTADEEIKLTKLLNSEQKK